MRFETTIGSNGQIKVPTEALTDLHLEPDALVEVEIRPLPKAGISPDWEAVEKIAARVRGPILDAMRAEGYDSVDAYIHDIRDRKAFEELEAE